MVDDAGDRPKPVVTRITLGRSPAYPYLSLEKALDRAEQIRAAGAHRQAMPAETFYHIWKFGPLSSGARQTLAALNIFGLVDYIGRGDERKVRLSELAQRIVLDKQERSPERDAAIREAALFPGIHGELFDKFGGILPSNIVIQTFLERDKGYNESAAKALIAEYRETLSFSGLDKPDGMPSEGERSDPFEERTVIFSGGSLWKPFQSPAASSRATTVASSYPMNMPTPPSEDDVMRGRLSSEATYKLYVSGPFGVREIDTLIKLLQAQRDVLIPPTSLPQGSDTPPRGNEGDAKS